MQNSENLRVRDIRTLPFLWIHRALIDVIRPSWKALVAYNALAYHASKTNSGTCKDISIPALGALVSVSEDTMKRGLAELAAKGAIRIKPRHKRDGNKLPNDYILIDLSGPREQLI
jgi:hypothetical protein